MKELQATASNNITNITTRVTAISYDRFQSDARSFPIIIPHQPVVLSSHAISHIESMISTYSAYKLPQRFEFDLFLSEVDRLMQFHSAPQYRSLVIAVIVPL